MKKQGFAQIIIILSLIGLVLSGYLLNLHYVDKKAACDINEIIQCGAVNKSTYSEFFGIPVALIGMMGYIAIGTISFLIYQPNLIKIFNNKTIEKLISGNTLLILATIGLLFSLYLTYAEIFIIKAICPLCVLSQINIFAITMLGLKTR